MDVFSRTPLELLAEVISETSLVYSGTLGRRRVGARPGIQTKSHIVVIKESNCAFLPRILVVVGLAKSNGTTRHETLADPTQLAGAYH